MAVGNFTPEPIQWQWQGRMGKIKPGEIITDKDRGWENHVLNKWGPRGLVRLDYGDEPDSAKEESMRLYQSFWERQISNFNEHNEQLKNENKPYIRPTRELTKKAEEFGVKLIGPWKLEDLRIEKPSSSGDSKKVENLEKDVASLKKDVGGMMEMLKDFISSQSEDDGKKAAKK